jgi:hypothetical protein
MSHVVTQRSNSKRAPYPVRPVSGHDQADAGTGVGRESRRPESKTLDATAPVDYTYSSANPFKERTFEWTKLYGGYGQVIEHDQTPRRYEHAEYVDTSINGTMFKGPKFYGEDGDSGRDRARQDLPVHLGHAWRGRSPVRHLRQRRGRRTSDTTWVVSLGASPLDRPCGSSPGRPASWTVCTSRRRPGISGSTTGRPGPQPFLPAGPGTGTANGEARYIEKVQDELWVAGDYWVVKTTAGADPLLRQAGPG